MVAGTFFPHSTVASKNNKNPVKNINKNPVKQFASSSNHRSNAAPRLMPANKSYNNHI